MMLHGLMTPAARWQRGASGSGTGNASGMARRPASPAGRTRQECAPRRQCFSRVPRAQAAAAALAIDGGAEHGC